jgi:phosphoglycolate phosphatase-like HAD superfamily hydrolase
MTTWVSQATTLNLIEPPIAQREAAIRIVSPPVKSVLFDFDGTIADSLQASLAIGNRLAVEYGIEPVTPEKLDRWQHLSAQEILQELDISMFRLPGMLRRFKAEIKSEVDRFPMIPGMREAILTLWDKEYVLGVVTSNSADNVRKFLAHQGIEHLFNFVESCPRLMGKDRVLRRIARQHKLDLSKMLYVGDEVRDIDAAKKIHVQSVAVTWGFNSTEVLQAHQPDYLIDRPQQLVEIAKQL